MIKTVFFSLSKSNEMSSAVKSTIPSQCKQFSKRIFKDIQDRLYNNRRKALYTLNARELLARSGIDQI